MEPRKQKKTKSTPVAGFANRAAKAAHESIDDLKGRATRAEEQFMRRAEARGKAAADETAGIVKRLTNYVEDHPFRSVVLAFGVGILATAMLRATGINLAELLAQSGGGEDDLVD